jgi:RNA polymerase sigma-70 factor (ECF subfamily)
LIRRCANSDEAAWREFIRRFHRAISISVMRVAKRWGSMESAGDLVQDTYLKLCSDKCARLLAFASIHPELVEAYVRTIALNVANDFFKADRSWKRGRGEIVQLLDVIEPKASEAGAGGAERIQREILLQQIDRWLAEARDRTGNSRDQLIFWLHYRQGMTAQSIASLPALGLTVKGVESVLHRLTRQVRTRIATARQGS